MARHPAPLPERIHVLTALHACDTATDDAVAVALRQRTLVLQAGRVVKDEG